MGMLSRSSWTWFRKRKKVIISRQECTVCRDVTVFCVGIVSWWMTVSSAAAFCDVMNSALEGRSVADQYKDILGDPLHLLHYSAATNHYFHYWFGLKNVNKVEKLLIKVPRSTKRRLQIVSFIQQAVKSLKDSSFAVICGMEKQLIAHLKTQKMTHAALPVAGVVSDRTPKPPFIKY